MNTLGHDHPALVEAVTTQLRTLGHVSNFFATEPQVALAERLLEHLPGPRGSARGQGLLRQLRRRGQRGRVQADPAHRPHPRRGDGGGLPRPHHGQPGADRQGGLPRAVRAAARARHLGAVRATPTRWRRRSPTRRPPSSSSRCRARPGVNVAPADFLVAAREITERARRPALVRRGADRHGPHRHLVRQPAAPASSADIVTLAKGLGGGLPDRRLPRLRPGGDALRARQPRHHVRRQPAVVRRGAGGDRHDRARRTARARHRGRGAAARPSWPSDDAGRRGARGRRAGRAHRCPSRTRPAVVAAAQEAGFIVNATGPDRVRLAPPLVVTDADVDALLGGVAGHPRRGVPGDVMTTRHFLRDDDLTPAEQAAVLDLALKLKARRTTPDRSTARRRSRCSSTSRPCAPRPRSPRGIAELGGFPMIIDGALAQVGVRESVADTARVLGRQASAIVWRTHDQSRLEEMAAYAGVPVVNALTDQFHPCQALADLLTIREHRGELAGQTLAFVGDPACNMAHSLLLAGATAGMHVRVSGPEAYQPDPAVLAAERRRSPQAPAARPTTSRTLPRPPAAPTCWSPTPGSRWAVRTRRARGPTVFAPWRLDDDLLAHAAADAIVLHCLPAYRGKEITAEVIDGPRSVVWDEAENRRHAQKAVLDAGCWEDSSVTASEACPHPGDQERPPAAGGRPAGHPRGALADRAGRAARRQRRGGHAGHAEPRPRRPRRGQGARRLRRPRLRRAGRGRRPLAGAPRARPPRAATGSPTGARSCWSRPRPAPTWSCCAPRPAPPTSSPRRSTRPTSATCSAPSPATTPCWSSRATPPAARASYDD